MVHGLNDNNEAQGLQADVCGPNLRKVKLLWVPGSKLVSFFKGKKEKTQDYIYPSLTLFLFFDKQVNINETRTL